MEKTNPASNRFLIMIIYSPLIGWGIFGFGYAHYLAYDHPLYLSNSFSYALVTLVLHLIYGFILGYLNSRWLAFRQATP